MADPKAFLSRWSRLKRQAAEQPSSSPEKAPEDQVTDRGGAPEDIANATVKPPAEAPPSIDLSALPSIETITATTDIRPFLAAGVPVEVARAALRRAWVADPKIRNFIGIAENQWDFTAPETIPGFGALKTIDDVRQLVADVLGDSQRVAAEATSAPERTSGQPVDVGEGAPAISDDIQQAVTGQSIVPADQTSGLSVSAAERDSGIVQHSINYRTVDEHDDHDEIVKPPRRHGGALPE
jgi:hypothetical protein